MAAAQVTICNSSNQILSKLLRGETDHRLNVLYVEFAAGPPVSVEVDPAENALEYYAELKDTGRDYMRIPVLSVTAVTEAEKTKPDDIKLYFNGLCTLEKGVHGESAAGKKIYGLALVAAPNGRGDHLDDLTKDIVWARGYYKAGEYMEYDNMSQTAVTFTINLKT